MVGFVLRVVTVALGLWLATKLISGIEVQDGWRLLAAALLLGIVNAVVRPVVVVLTLPLSILTLGLFLLVINAAMLGLVSWLLGGFEIAGFWSALFGSMIISATGWLASGFIGPRGRVGSRRWYGTNGGDYPKLQRGREGAAERLAGFCQVLEEALAIAHKDLDRLILARELMSRVTARTRSDSKLPELVELFLSRQQVTVPPAAKLLKVTPKAVDLMLVQLGGALPRKLTGRTRYCAWGIV